MFTGLIETMGTVDDVRQEAGGRQLSIREPRLAAELAIGESVAVNGACLTVVLVSGSSFAFQAGPETLARTNLGTLEPGSRVNLERALRLSDRLGGHIVQGHVDGVGRIDRWTQEGEWRTAWFTCPPELSRQMVSKGSVAVDGVSLTLVDVREGSFSVALIPHTLSATTLGHKQPGEPVNLETDLLAKYVARLLGRE